MLKNGVICTCITDVLKLFRLTRILLPPSFIGVIHIIEAIISFLSNLLETFVILMIKGLQNEEFLLCGFKRTLKCWNDGTTNSQAH